MFRGYIYGRKRYETDSNLMQNKKKKKKKMKKKVDKQANKR